MYQNLQDTIKAMFREKFLALSRYSSKEDKMLKLNMKLKNKE